MVLEKSDINNLFISSLSFQLSMLNLFLNFPNSAEKN